MTIENNEDKITILYEIKYICLFLLRLCLIGFITFVMSIACIALYMNGFDNFILQFMAPLLLIVIGSIC